MSEQMIVSIVSFLVVGIVVLLLIPKTTGQALTRYAPAEQPANQPPVVTDQVSVYTRETLPPQTWYLDESMEASGKPVKNGLPAIGVDSHNCPVYPGYGWCPEMQKCTSVSNCTNYRNALLSRRPIHWLVPRPDTQINVKINV